MTSRDFAYWLQGFYEIAQPTSISVEQTAMIRRHLALVFKHEIDPSLDGGDPAVRAERQSTHDGTPPVPAMSPGQPGFKPFHFSPDSLSGDHPIHYISC